MHAYKSTVVGNTFKINNKKVVKVVHTVLTFLYSEFWSAEQISSFVSLGSKGLDSLNPL